MRLVGTAILLMALWLLMSGLYKPLIIGLGALSVLLAMWFSRRMDSFDDDRIELRLHAAKTVSYSGWLMVEIAKANWAVTRIIISASMPIRQNLFRIPYSQETDLGQVIFANSITLTPGTITVETEAGQFLVHALRFSDSDIDALADMNRRIAATEEAKKS